MKLREKNGIDIATENKRNKVMNWLGWVDQTARQNIVKDERAKNEVKERER